MILLSYQVAPQRASGELTRVLGAFEEAALPVQVIHREGRHGSAKVRSFVDLAVERLRADQALNSPRQNLYFPISLSPYLPISLAINFSTSLHPDSLKPRRFCCIS